MSSDHKEESKRRRKEQRETTNTENNKITINTYLSVINWNVNRIYSPIKRRSGWMDKKKNQDPTVWCLTLYGGTHAAQKWRDGKKIFYANENQKKAEVAILISDKNRL